MSMNFNSESFSEDEDNILSRGHDGRTGANIVLISCPPEALNGADGPVFEHLDNKTVYILINERFVESIRDSAPNSMAGAVQYGMLLGDVMRRGIYYAQNINRKKKNKTNKRSNNNE
jgi:hypothetical protein